jgi:hypothetical protein
LAPPQVYDDPRLPRRVQQRVVRIREILDDIETRAAGSGIPIEERIELEQLQTSHVPRLLQSYLDIPPQHRSKIFQATGHSASFVLTERLDRLIERLAEISELLAQGDLDAFVANIRFIDTRYGRERLGP